MSEKVKWSQVSCIGKPQPRTWDDYEEGCVGAFRGGYRDPVAAEAFVHGMRTVFNLLRDEFPPAEVIRQQETEIERLKQKFANEENDQ
jgi:hypothetical protein